MDVTNELKKAYENRLLETQTELDEFEKALSKLMAIGDTSIVGDLCKIFDDATEHHEVMFGLVHGIEYLYAKDIEEGLCLIAQAVPQVIDVASEWMYVLHYRILNCVDTRRVYGRVLSLLDCVIQEIILNLLGDIKSENPEMFSDSVDDLLRSRIKVRGVL